MAAMMAIAVSATAMPFETAREEALFLSDKMAYEQDLTESQYEAGYGINLDYLLNVNCEADVLGTSWIIRNRDLSHVLSDRHLSADKEFRRNIGHNKDSHHRHIGRGHR